MKGIIISLMMTVAAASAQVPEPADFHGEPYRAPVPQTLTGAQVISGHQAVAMAAKGVPFLDVLPQVKRPEGLPADTLWHAAAHKTIPGAVWLADTGYDRLSSDEMRRLTDGLATATHGDKAAPVVIFCKADCWMSWNAARRAVLAGYTGVQWFPAGIEGWVEAGGAPLTEVSPAR